MKLRWTYKEEHRLNKILLVSGSNRDNYSYRILKEIQKSISTAKLIKLKDYNIEFCKGCLFCDKNAKCIIDDDLDKVINHILENEIIVFAIPNYFGGMSGFFKNFIDRLHYMYKRSILRNKKFVFIYTGAVEDDSITMEEMTKATCNIEKYLELSVIKRYSFSSRKELDIKKINDIIEFLNK